MAKVVWFAVCTTLLGLNVWSAWSGFHSGNLWQPALNAAVACLLITSVFRIMGAI